MDYLLSYIYPSSVITIVDTNTEIHSVTVTYKDAVNTINEFLKSRKIDCVNKPAGGGEHNPKDKRVKKLVNDAMSTRVYNDFIDDINYNLPFILQHEIKKQHILTMESARKRLANYMYRN